LVVKISGLSLFPRQNVGQFHWAVSRLLIPAFWGEAMPFAGKTTHPVFKPDKRRLQYEAVL
jgi:hypothetical protein